MRPIKPGRCTAPRARQGQQGYVLLFVTVALTVVAIVATHFALRIDELRAQALTLQQYADARLQAASARAQALYWLSTRPIGLASAGFIDEQPLMMDGRSYRTDEGALLRVQDGRGLLSLNKPDRGPLMAALVDAGASTEESAALIDVLEDYADSDNLRRLNGAEAPDYAAQGLPAPRNDWIASVDELSRIAVWHGKPELRAKMAPYLSVKRDSLFNPNTAPLDLMRSIWPKASKEQWDLFETLRRRAPFGDKLAAISATGIPFTSDELLFHASNALSLQVWAPGLPQSLEYNLLILPTANNAPWLIHEVRQTTRPATIDAASPVANFPVPSQSVVTRSRAAALPTP